jgi:hypothetical protein
MDLQEKPPGLDLPLRRAAGEKDRFALPRPEHQSLSREDRRGSHRREGPSAELHHRPSGLAAGGDHHRLGPGTQDQRLLHGKLQEQASGSGLDRSPGGDLSPRAQGSFLRGRRPQDSVAGLDASHRRRGLETAQQRLQGEKGLLGPLSRLPGPVPAEQGLRLR